MGDDWASPGTLAGKLTVIEDDTAPGGESEYAAELNAVNAADAYYQRVRLQAGKTYWFGSHHRVDNGSGQVALSVYPEANSPEDGYTARYKTTVSSVYWTAVECIIQLPAGTGAVFLEVSMSAGSANSKITSTGYEVFEVTLTESVPAPAAVPEPTPTPDLEPEIDTVIGAGKIITPMKPRPESSKDIPGFNGSGYFGRLGNDDIFVIIDGKRLVFDVPPVMKNDRVLVPLRVIFEELGMKVDWNEATETVTAAGGGTTVVLKIGSDQPTVNGTAVPIDVPAETVGGRTMVPVRFVAEATGAKVEWDEPLQTVLITSAALASGKPPTPAATPRPTTAPAPASTPAPASSGGSAAGNRFKIQIDGKDTDFAPTFQVGSMNYIPFAEVFEALGATVTVEGTSGVAVRDGNTFKFEAGSDKATLNGEEVVLNAAPVMRGDALCVTVRTPFLSGMASVPEWSDARDVANFVRQ